MRYRPPTMRRKRERGRSDPAYTILDGKRHHLGPWGSLQAEQKFLELANPSSDEKPTPEVSPKPPEPLPAKPTIVEIMAPFMRFIVTRFADNATEVGHFKGAMRVLKGEFGNLPADEFGPRKLRYLQEVMTGKE